MSYQPFPGAGLTAGRMIRWRNARESVVGFALLGVNANAMEDVVRLGCVVVHQADIARQRDMLRLVPYWYRLPLVAGLVAGGVVKWNTQLENARALDDAAAAPRH